MGSSINPLVDNLFMEEFESKAINTALNTPRLWLRWHADDTFVIQQENIANSSFNILIPLTHIFNLPQRL